MTKVHCQETMCEYWRKDSSREDDGLCSLNEIELDADNMCYSYRAHTDLSPEYRETFWKRMKSWADEHECKNEGRGKRYEMIGLTWFTDQDDRWGTDEIWFTEQRSGLRCQGKDINENAELIREKVESVSPVENLPEAAINDL